MFQDKRPFGRLHRPHRKKVVEIITLEDDDDDPWEKEDIQEIEWGFNNKPKYPLTRRKVNRPVSPGKRAEWTRESQFWSKRGRRYIPVGTFPQNNWRKRRSRLEREVNPKRYKRKREKEMLESIQDRIAVREAGMYWPGEDDSEDDDFSETISWHARFWRSSDKTMTQKSFVESRLTTNKARIYKALILLKRGTPKKMTPLWLENNQQRWDTAEKLHKYGLVLKEGRSLTKLDYNLWIIPFLKEEYGEYWRIYNPESRFPWLVQTDIFGNEYAESYASDSASENDAN